MGYPFLVRYNQQYESGFVQKPGTTQIVAIWPFQLNI